MDSLTAKFWATLGSIGIVFTGVCSLQAATVISSIFL